MFVWELASERCYFLGSDFVPKNDQKEPKFVLFVSSFYVKDLTYNFLFLFPLAAHAIVPFRWNSFQTLIVLALFLSKKATS